MKENLSFYLSFLTLNGLILLSFNSQSQDFSYSADELYSDSANNSLTFEGNVSLNFEEFIFIYFPFCVVLVNRKKMDLVHT